MITLSLKESGELLGEIGETDLKVLVAWLEEEDEQDTDYYITPMTIDLLEKGGAGPKLLEILRNAVGDSEGVEVVWQES
jgi:hypothetical protein